MKRLFISLLLILGTALSAQASFTDKELDTYARNIGIILGFIYDASGNPQPATGAIFADDTERDKVLDNIALSWKRMEDLSSILKDKKPTYCAVYTGDATYSLNMLLSSKKDLLCKNHGVTAEELAIMKDDEVAAEKMFKKVADCSTDPVCNAAIGAAYTAVKNFWSTHAALLPSEMHSL